MIKSSKNLKTISLININSSVLLYNHRLRSKRISFQDKFLHTILQLQAKKVNCHQHKTISPYKIHKRPIGPKADKAPCRNKTDTVNNSMITVNEYQRAAKPVCPLEPRDEASTRAVQGFKYCNHVGAILWIRHTYNLHSSCKAFVKCEYGLGVPSLASPM